VSSYVVGDDEIDLLVSQAITGPTVNHFYWNGRPMLDSDMDEIGRMLIAENHASISYAYSPEPASELGVGPIGYTWRATPPTIDPVVVLKAINNYCYQSCEHPGWADSDARKFCDLLRDKTIRSLPGYDEAPWEWTRTA